MVKKFILLSITFYTFVFVANAQCNVKTEDIENGKLYTSGSETIYKTTGYVGDGARLISSRITLLVDPVKDDGLIFLYILAGAVRLEPLVPRSIMIEFTDGSTFEKRAGSYEEKSAGGNPVHIGSFELSDSELMQLSKPISKLVVKDHYNGQTIEATPYEGILAEQINCVLQRYEKSF